MEDGYDAVNVARARALATGGRWVRCPPRRSTPAARRGAAHPRTRTQTTPRSSPGPRHTGPGAHPAQPRRRRTDGRHGARYPDRPPRRPVPGGHPRPRPRDPPAGDRAARPVGRGPGKRAAGDAPRVRDGLVPLVGRPRSPGTFHHGALYYYLLAPAAFLTDVDPHAIVLTMALLGLATVAAIWALGYAVGGRWTAHVAGVLAAVSPALVLGSTFIWNPNPVPLGAALAVLGGGARLDPVLGPLVAARGPRVHGRDAAARQRRAPRAAAPARVGPRPGPPAQRRARPGARGGARRRRDHRGRVPATLRPRAGHGFADTQGLVSYLRGGAGVGASGDLATRMSSWWHSARWRGRSRASSPKAPMASARSPDRRVPGAACHSRSAGGGNRARPALLLFHGDPALVAAPRWPSRPDPPERRGGPPQRPLPHVPRPDRDRHRGHGDRGRRRTPWGASWTWWASGGRASVTTSWREGSGSWRWPRSWPGVGVALAASALGRGRWVAARRRSGRRLHLGSGRGVVDAGEPAGGQVRRTRSASRWSGATRCRRPRSPGRTPPGGVIIVCDPLFEDLMGHAVAARPSLANATRSPGARPGPAGPVRRRLAAGHGLPRSGVADSGPDHAPRR